MSMYSPNVFAIFNILLMFLAFQLATLSLCCGLYEKISSNVPSSDHILTVTGNISSFMHAFFFSSQLKKESLELHLVQSHDLICGCS